MTPDQQPIPGADTVGGPCPRVESSHRRTARRIPSTGGKSTGSNGQGGLEPGGLAMLAVLGTVSEGFGTFPEIVAAARSIAPMDWQPTREVLETSVGTALDHGLLRCDATAERTTATRLALSAAGRGRLRELLRQPAHSCRGPIGRAATALKVCFLGALDPQSGCRILEDLSRSLRGDLESLRQGCVTCPASRAYARQCMDREIERIEEEVAWLRRLQADLCANRSPRTGRGARNVRSN